MQNSIQNARLQEIELELEDLATIATRLFRRAGELLAEIRDKKLYRDAGYSSFEVYVTQRWHMTRGRAYHLVNAALAVSDLSEHFQEEQLPQNESVVRPLVPLEPDERIEVWSEVPANPQRKDVAALVEAHKIVGAYPLIGSKWKMSQKIAERVREIEFEKYLEPFVGSGAVFFRLVDEELIKKPAVLNDLNQLAIALFRTLATRPDELQQRLMLVPNARIERMQPEPASDADELEKAVWWAIHTYQGYVGHKTKNKGWSVDHSSHARRHEKWNRFKEQIPAMGFVLCERAAFECMDGLEFIRRYTRKSDRNLLYIDPPYFEHEDTYHAYFEQHQELAEILAEVPAAGVFCTYYDHELVREFYSQRQWDWELFERWSTCTADGVRQRRDEVLLTRKERVSYAYAAPQIQKAIAPSPIPITQNQSSSQVKSRVEYFVTQIQAECQPGEIQQIISLLKHK
jgi:site-specific DNA-adenine methylase